MRCLLDTGSTVSTISQSWYDAHLSEVPVKPLDTILEIECADGKNLPYSGYIEVDICLENTSGSFLLLIIPDSRYNEHVPLLLGTNVLHHFMMQYQEVHGPRFLQTAKLKTPWYLAFRILNLREKELRRNKFRIGIVKCAESTKITMRPNTERTIRGYICHQLMHVDTPVIMEPTELTTMNKDLDVAPMLLQYQYKYSHEIPVVVSNVTNRTITVQPKAILCEIQPVTVEKIMGNGKEESKTGVIDSVNINTETLSESQIQQGEHLLCDYSDIFSKNDLDIGFTSIIKHKINLTDERPFKQRYRKIPPSIYEEVRNHLQQMLEAGIIRRSHSPFASNIVLVRKKDNSLRICTDFRFLNSRTINDAYSLPRVDEILEALSGSKYFSVLDMKSGYHQVEIDEHHKERTAFTVGPLGFFEYNRMPFGLSNAPATYQRLMELCLDGLHLSICFIYLDDVIIFSNSFEEHLDRLQKVLERIRQSGLKLSPKKCFFFQEKVKYVGHVVSQVGIEADPDKIEKVRSWPTPTTSGEQVRQFLGFAGYYRKFVKNFSKIAKPLLELMPAPKKSSKDKKWQWGDAEQRAFEELKVALTSPPVLGYPDYQTPFEVHVDASQAGLGAVLYQKQEGHKRVICYASRGLSRSEKHYSAFKLEFLHLNGPLLRSSTTTCTETILWYTQTIIR